VGGIGGLAYGPTDGGWAFAHQFAQPDHRRAVFTFVAAETPSNLVAVTAISAAVFFVGDPNETYREWNVESQSLARWPRCTDRSFGGTDLTVSAGQRRSIRRRTPIADRGADLVEVRLLLCSRALLGSDVNRSIRSAGRKRVGLAPAAPD